MRYLSAMTNPTDRFDTVPIDNITDPKVGSDGYAAPNEVPGDRSRSPIDRDQAVERWLRDDVLDGHAEYLQDPSRAVPTDELLNYVKGRRGEQARK